MGKFKEILKAGAIISGVLIAAAAEVLTNRENEKRVIGSLELTSNDYDKLNGRYIEIEVSKGFFGGYRVEAVGEVSSLWSKFISYYGKDFKAVRIMGTINKLNSSQLLQAQILELDNKVTFGYVRVYRGRY